MLVRRAFDIRSRAHTKMPQPTATRTAADARPPQNLGCEFSGTPRAPGRPALKRTRTEQAPDAPKKTRRGSFAARHGRDSTHRWDGNRNPWALFSSPWDVSTEKCASFCDVWWQKRAPRRALRRSVASYRFIISSFPFFAHLRPSAQACANGALCVLKNRPEPKN